MDYDWVIGFELKGAGLVGGRWSRGALSLAADRSPNATGQRVVYGAIRLTTQSASRESATKEGMDRVGEFLDILAVGTPMVGFFSGFPRIQNASAICATSSKSSRQDSFLPGTPDSASP